MPQATSPSISCPHCGRAFPWKPALAGKKGKCSCGQILTIPITPPAPPPPAEDALDALYSLAEPAPDVLPAPPPVHPSRPALSLEYSKPPKPEFSYDALTDNLRDVYIPTGLLVAGFIAILVWAATQLSLPPALLAIVSLITGVTTAVKTFIIIGLAILFAPALGVSFGFLRTAILKFAAILVVTDAALLWLEFIMESTGAIPTSGRYYVRGTATVNLLLATAIIGFLIHYLFDMDPDEMGKIAVAMAVMSRLIGFGMKILAVVIISAIVASISPTPPTAAAPATPATAASVNAATPAPTSPPPNAIRIIETPADRDIVQRLAKNPFIRDGRESRNQLASTRGMREFIDRTLAAGAVKVSIELGNKNLQPANAYVELPTDPAARGRCFSEAAAVCQSYGHRVDSTSDTNQRYLTVSFKQPR